MCKVMSELTNLEYDEYSEKAETPKRADYSSGSPPENQNQASEQKLLKKRRVLFETYHCVRVIFWVK